MHDLPRNPKTNIRVVLVYYLSMFQKRKITTIINMYYDSSGRRWIPIDKLLQEIGDRVRQARLAKRMSQMDLAESVGMSVSFISNIEVGKQSMNIRALIAISDVLNVSADWLLRSSTESDVTIDEILKELENCTPKEREVILKLVQTMKDSIHNLKVTDDD